MGYLKAFLGPFLKDKMIWAALASWALTALNVKLALGMDADMVTATAASISTFAVGRLAYVLNKKRKDAAKTNEKK